MVPYSPIESLAVFNESGAAIQNVVVVALKERLMKPGVLTASMDPFGFYRGRLLPERYAFCELLVKKTSFFVLKVFFSMFELFKPDFEAILLSVRKLPPV